jgi:hypothetical protein
MLISNYFFFLLIISTVSFYGASHITMPIQEAKISTNVRLRFRTHQENALIFLSSGRTDFCLLALDYGRIKLNFKIDDYTLEVGDYYYSYKTSDF